MSYKIFDNFYVVLLISINLHIFRKISHNPFTNELETTMRFFFKFQNFVEIIIFIFS